MAKRYVEAGINFDLRYKYIPSNFEDVRGYIPLKDYIGSSVAVWPIFQINKGIIKKFYFSGSYSLWQTTAYSPLKKSGAGGLEITFIKNLSTSFSLNREKRWYGIHHYENKLWTLSGSYQPGGMSGVNLSYTSGDYWGGKLYYPSVSLNYTFLGKLTNSLNVSYQMIKYPNTIDKELITALIPSFSIRKNLNLRSFLQWSDKSKVLMANFLLDWDVVEKTKLYIAFNRKAEINSSGASPEEIFFLKIGSGFSF